MYKHILVPTDLSEESKQTIIKALDLAQRYSAKLSILHVIETLPAYSYFGEDVMEGETITHAEEELAKLAESLGVTEADEYIEVGSTKKQILRIAEEIACDLIVVGSHGAQGWSRLLGATAEAIVHGAHCDVMTVRVAS